MLALGSKIPFEAALDSVLPTGHVLLVFFKISCPTCHLALPFLERLHQSGRLPVCGISQDEASDTRDFAGSNGLTFPILLDSGNAHYPTSTAYRIETVPSLFLISADGTIEWTMEGFSRKDLEGLGMAFESPIFMPGEFVPEFKPG